MNECIIGIGSNIEAEKNISEMLKLLSIQVTIIKVSEFIKTTPVGLTDQPDFTNGAVKIKTHFEKEELNLILKKIEDDMGRDRSLPKYGPRIIDLDITIWNNEIVDDDYFSRDFLRNVVDEVW